jgi:PBSX family phage terminase large subunit
MQLKKDCEASAESINESRLEVRLVNGSSISLRGWENIETLRGQKYDFIVVDEVAMMRNFWENWSEIIRPTLTDTKGEGLFISTPKGFNHFYDLYNVATNGFPGGNGKPDPDFASFTHTTYDNPHIPKEEVDKAKEELTEDRFAQEYLADFRKTEGLVYKEFDRRVHVITDVEEWLAANGQQQSRRYGGVDFGFVHPAAVLSVIETNDSTFIVTDEWYHTERTDEQIAEYTASEKYQVVYPDPANAGGVQELRRQGCNVRDVIKGKDSVKNGINTVRELFKAGRLLVHASCKNLIFELETYSYGEANSKTGKIDENPIKENDDAVDALRYVIMMTSNKRGYNKMTIKKPTFVGFNRRT